jgi:hypothetical protein
MTLDRQICRSVQRQATKHYISCHSKRYQNQLHIMLAKTQQATKAKQGSRIYTLLLTRGTHNTPRDRNHIYETKSKHTSLWDKTRTSHKFMIGFVPLQCEEGSSRDSRSSTQTRSGQEHLQPCQGKHKTTSVHLQILDAAKMLTKL